MSAQSQVPKALAINLTTRGYVFVQFNSPMSPFDWGERVIKAHDKHEATLKDLRLLIEKFGPDVLVIEDAASSGFKRGARARKLYRDINRLADSTVISCLCYSREAIFRAFSKYDPRNKHDVAKVIAAHIPEFQFQLPAKRKAWQSQSSRQLLFHAISLGITFYAADGYYFTTASS